MKKIAVFLGLFSVIGFARAVDYCRASKSLCNFGVKHISCYQRGKFAAGCPSDAAMVEMNDYMINVILKEHNEKRNFIAGGEDDNHDPACRMASMKWDTVLARMAALNVKTCRGTYDMCHNTPEYRYSGQNLASFSVGDIPNVQTTFEKAISLWYGEVTNSKRAYIASFPDKYRGPPINHFTLMMGERNNRVGCAAATYTMPGRASKTFVVVCNYATINMIDLPIYATCHAAGSACQTGKNPNYPSLCSTEEVYDVNKWY